jgi:hypothetical protein
MLLQKLRHEVTRWSREASGDAGLETPDYIILATNTSIRAAFGPEGRDAIDAYIQCLSGHLIGGWAIWDETDLLRMLDTYPRVRNVFVPIMASTRLAVELIDSYRTDRPD